VVPCEDVLLPGLCPAVLLLLVVGELQVAHLPVVGVKVHGVQGGAAGHGGGGQGVPPLLPFLLLFFLHQLCSLHRSTQWSRKGRESDYTVKRLAARESLVSALQRQNGENLKQIFPEKEYRGLSPNFITFMCL
jgi:hypothetical protein